MLDVANYMLEQGMELARPLRLIDYSSETLLPAVKAQLQRAFGNPPVIGVFDMTEFVGNMAMCAHGRFHLDFETCCVEAAPIAAATRAGYAKLIFTGWGNPAMPFIRYDVGDLVRPAGGPCPCGRQSPAFISIDGRLDDFVRTPDGRMAFGLNVHLPSAREVQVYQRRLEEIEVRVAPGAAYDAGEEGEMVRRLRHVVGEQIRIRIVKMESIPRSSSGKFRAVVSELPGESAGERELAEAARG
jgi:phenylacetate-CoA ligase